MNRELPIDEDVRERVRQALGESFLIEAGAGTGKTSLIIDRLVALIESGVQLGRIVAITYTEKAASEMKLRLRDRLHDLRASPAIARALDSIEEAPVGTIHSFASGILRQHPVEAGVDPAFRVADETEADILRDQAWQQAFVTLLERSPAEIVRALDLGLSAAAVESALCAMAWQLPDGVETPPPVPEETLGALAAAQEALEAIAAQMEALRVREGDTLAARVEKVLAGVRSLAPVDGPRRDRRLLELEVGSCKRLGSKVRWRNAGALDDARVRMGELGTELERAKAAIMHNAAIGWLGLARELRDAYARCKRAAAVLDFDDLLLFTRGLLAKDESVRRRVAARFDAIIVDEFQDTDPVQADIVRRLCSDQEGRPIRGRVFIVGDPKQSIYAFRGADIESYVDFREWLREGGGRIESITHSFRPVRELLTFANEVSSRLFPSPGSRWQPSYEPLTGGDEVTGRIRPSITVLAPDPMPDSPDLAGQAEAWAVADLIGEAIESWPVRERPSGKERPLRAGDVAILLPAMTGPLDHYEAALQARRIPYVVSGGKRFYRSVEVVALQAATAAIDDPSDRLALVAALRSPFFGVSDDALVRRASGPNGLTILHPDGEDEVAPALRLLGELHRRRNDAEPARILGELVDRTGALGVFALKPDGMQRVQNLLKLVDEARRLADAGRLSFRQLSRMLTERAQGRHAEAQGPAAEAGEGIQILTVHKSKGLEFGMVVLGALAHAGRSNAIHALAHEGLAQGAIKARDFSLESLGYREACEARKRTLDAEKRRLSYVALTRARDHLVLPLYPTKEKPTATLALLGEAIAEITSILGGEAASRLGAVPIDLRRAPPRPADDLVRPKLDLEEVVAAATRAAGGPARASWAAEREALVARSSRSLVHLVPSHLHEPEPAAGVPRPEARSGGAEVGIAVHAALEAADLGDPRSAADLAVWHAKNLGHEEQSRAGDLAARALSFPVIGRARSATRLWRELPFSLAIDGGTLTGSVDLAFEEAGGLVIVDYKTDQVCEDAVDARMAVHRPQLAVYALALGRITGKKVAEVHALFLSPGIARTIAVSDELLAAARRDIERAVGREPAR
ncbi:MAG: UvrD-helicase domain-containing protein [Deltaproteobacteria bacterium]|nr:UvrD-helicase domain-containing protein [Deltaproteobacteria bacterium]